MKTALELFRAGNDTKVISRILRITEAKALELVTEQRGVALGLPSPYGHGEPNFSVRQIVKRNGNRTFFVRPRHDEPDWFLEEIAN